MFESFFVFLWFWFLFGFGLFFFFFSWVFWRFWSPWIWIWPLCCAVLWWIHCLFSLLGLFSHTVNPGSALHGLNILCFIRKSIFWSCWNKERGFCLFRWKVLSPYETCGVGTFLEQEPRAEQIMRLNSCPALEINSSIQLRFLGLNKERGKKI